MRINLFEVTAIETVSSGHSPDAFLQLERLSLCLKLRVNVGALRIFFVKLNRCFKEFTRPGLYCRLLTRVKC